MTSPVDPRESIFPRELAVAVGYVVLEAAQCEDTLAELAVLLRGETDEPDPDWWASGEQLAKALERLGLDDAAALADDYRTLQLQRNQVVHGLWLVGPSGHFTLKRTKGRKHSPPRYDLGVVSKKELSSLALAFNQLERRAAEAVSIFMGL